MMSSEDNKAMIHRIAGLFAKDTIDEYLSYYAPDAKLHFLPPGLPPGREGARVFYQMFLGAFPDARVRVDNLVGEGDVVAETFVLEGTHTGPFQGIPPTGKPVRVTGMTMMRVVNGQIVERWSEADFLGLMQQIGAVPAGA
jgi:predicted ester cyclase